MFGPGTHCRCATCTSLPYDCTWSGGPYAGTLLLYAQVTYYYAVGLLFYVQITYCYVDTLLLHAQLTMHPP
jgi:hypothetical protein